jgi:hypothetical protein
LKRLENNGGDTMKKKPVKKSLWKTVSGKIGGTAASMGRNIESAARRVKKGLTPTARRISSVGSKVSEAVDPASVGGAVVGLTAGQILGGIVGGTAGMALGGPVGAVAGVQLGGLTGGSVGLKLGYDVTHDTLHPKKKQGKKTVKEQILGVTRTMVKRSGDSVGSGAGALGGAVVGTVVAGPLGGAVGAFVGESLAGDFVENRSLETFDQRVSPTGTLNANKRPSKKQKGAKVGLVKTGKWAGGAMRDAVLEGGAEAALAAVGALVAGPIGARIAGRAGLVATKRVDWNEALAEKGAKKKGRKAKPPTGPIGRGGKLTPSAKSKSSP